MIEGTPERYFDYNGAMDAFVVNVDSPVGPWGVAGTSDALTAIYLPSQRRRASVGDVPTALSVAARQLEEYFSGQRRRFDVPLAPVAATRFQRAVWDALSEIPYGEVRTYAEVARRVAKPGAARAVGNANHANPFPIVVPCHRVVAANGLGGYGGGDEVKRYLLALEGLTY